MTIKKLAEARPRRSDVTVLAEPDELAAELRCQRELDSARRTDELARLRADAAHDRDRSDVAEESCRAELERTEREAQARADAELARMYREAMQSGERTRITAQLARSAESRALRLERLRALNLKVLVPVLLGFAAWSTTGVQQGAARLMHATTGDPMWWALWILEPVLIGAVVWIIIARTRLAASGGRITKGAERIAAACLGTSVLLNLVAAVPAAAPAGGWTAGAAVALLGSMVAHAIGPVGAAMTAHLIGAVDGSIANADPWHQDGRAVPRLAAMNLQPPASTTAVTSNSTSESTSQAASEPLPATVWPVTRGARRALPVVARPTASESAERIGSDQWERPVSEAPVEPPRKRSRARSSARRVNRGARVPAAARKSTPARRTDEQLLDEFVALVNAGNLPEAAPHRRVQDALRIGFERAKRVRELYVERLAELDVAPVQELENDESMREPTVRPELAVVGGDR